MATPMGPRDDRRLAGMWAKPPGFSGVRPAGRRDLRDCSRSTAASSVSRRAREMKAQSLAAGRRVGIETGAGHAGHADLGNEEARERDVVRRSRSPRGRSSRSRRRAAGTRRIPPRRARAPGSRALAVALARGPRSSVGHRQRDGGGLLQRRGRAHGEEVVHLADGVGDLRAAPGTSRCASRSRSRSWRDPEMVTVRSRMPSSVAIETCSPSKTMCS